MLVGVAMFSQTVTLSFTGRGRGGIVTEEIYQQIDSIKVRNITRGWEQMIYYPDTVVVMEPLAVPMLDVRQSGLAQNVPNPFDCFTEADLTLYESDVVALSVVGANGVEYAQYNGKLGVGTHTFEITLAVPQAYLLTATTSTGKYSVKMANIGSCGTDKISLKSSIDNKLKAKSEIENRFSLGDEMEYLAYTTNRNNYNDNAVVFNASIVQEQNGSEDIVFHFNIPYCEYSTNTDYMYGCLSYTWINGETYYETNSYAADMHLFSDGGCDSIVLLNVTIDHPVEVDDTILACHPIIWNGIACNNTGEYISESLYTMGGCDSVVTLHFYRVDNIRHDVYVEDCERYVWRTDDFLQVLTETGDYEHTFQSLYGCDSIVTVHFTKMSDIIYDTVITCDRFDWNDRTYEFGSNYGLTSVHFYDTARYTNQYGCDSIRILYLTLYKTRESYLDITHCGEFVYHDVTYSNSGTYTQRIPNFNGVCDSIVHLNLTITDFVENDIDPVSCDFYDYNGRRYTESGDYDVHFITESGCDSIVHVHLTIKHSSTSYLDETACDSYTWFGEEYTSSGDYTHTLPFGNREGCDSVITLHLTINETKTSEKNIDACHQYDLDGERIIETGDYRRTYRATNGCDSIVIYHINIYDDVYNEFSEYACGSFTWNDETYTHSGNYIQHFESAVHCDSIVTLHLFLGEPNTGIIDEQTACDSYEWEGTTYNASGNYTKTLSNIYGCDSVVTLSLTINPTYNVSFSHTECDSYEWEGTTYTATGTYPKTLHSVEGCDSVVTLNLTIKNSPEHELWDTSCGSYEWDGRTYTESGDHPWTYPAANGCDSIVTLHLLYNEFVTDPRDGNTYCTMKYGDQIWMTSNMKYLPQVDDSKSSTDPKYYVYAYSGTNLTQARNQVNYNRYGTLYNYVSAQTACPEGWRLPTKEEWQQLRDYLGQNSNYTCNGNSLNVAKALASTEYWTSSTATCAVGNDITQNNASKFNAMPGGYYNAGISHSSSFSEISHVGGWWTSSSTRHRVQLSNESPDVDLSPKAKNWGFSVRCIKDN